ncbi:MAG: hypothetical protein M1815_005049 [Lichina confinis]|nr:MAG: hypothetical protein M1815_005049 [Lichina confinis]
MSQRSRLSGTHGPSPDPSNHHDSLDEKVRKSVATCIWGADKDQNEVKKLLEFYLTYYIETTGCIRNDVGPRAANNENRGTLLEIVRQLKRYPNIRRKELESILKTAGLAASGESIDLDVALYLVVRAVFMISYRLAYKTIFTGQVVKPMWKQTESLDALVDRLFPMQQVDPSETASTIRALKLRARYLREKVGFWIEWTSHLPDHLYLEITDDRKTLILFGQVGYLQMHLQVLMSGDERISTAEGLALGCLPPSVVSETLRTLQLLFPENNEKCKAFLAKEIAMNNLDHCLSDSLHFYQGFHDDAGTAALPEDTHELFEQFPHWGKRLQRILREVEDPTPMAWHEKWSDRRKSPRFTYWAAVIALSVALLFGIAATVLGALQVYISYCSWQEDANKPGCRIIRSNPSAPPSTTGSTSV